MKKEQYARLVELIGVEKADVIRENFKKLTRQDARQSPGIPLCTIFDKYIISIGKLRHGTKKYRFRQFSR